MNTIEQWTIIAALVQAALITVLIILIKSEEKRMPRGKATYLSVRRRK